MEQKDWKIGIFKRGKTAGNLTSCFKPELESLHVEEMLGSRLSSTPPVGNYSSEDFNLLSLG